MPLDLANSFSNEVIFIIKTCIKFQTIEIKNKPTIAGSQTSFLYLETSLTKLLYFLSTETDIENKQNLKFPYN